MDKYYLLSVIDRLRSEMFDHPNKFKDNPIHNNCLPRMEKTLSSLQEELAKADPVETQPEKPGDHL